MKAFNRELADRLQAQMARHIDFVNAGMFPSHKDSMRIYKRLGDRMHQALVVRLGRPLVQRWNSYEKTTVTVVS